MIGCSYVNNSCIFLGNDMKNINLIKVTWLSHISCRLWLFPLCDYYCFTCQVLSWYLWKISSYWISNNCIATLFGMPFFTMMIANKVFLFFPDDGMVRLFYISHWITMVELSWTGLDLFMICLCSASMLTYT